MGRLAVGLLLVLVGAGCGGVETGSEEDLAGRVDALNAPPSMVELGDAYDEECPGNCPTYARWYDTTAPIELLRPELVRRMEASGVAVRDSTTTTPILTARNDTHIFFVVLDPAMIANNEYAPAGAEVEISVQLLRETWP